ncbi:MAG TPA: glycosyltransferase family 2 protein [Elusimicrobiota bacterium]|nr:glycosyltransferase family 2 protein [Elusimicrobiota bacterium]
MLSVLIPCLNEEDNLRRFPQALFPALKSLGRDFEVVLVDDGSSDGSWREISRLSEKLSNARAERHPRNLGLGAALATGFSACQGDWIAVLDADLTFPPEAISGLLARQRETGADMISGSPFLCPAPRGSWRRRIPSRILNALYGALLDPRLTSYTPIFRLYRAQIVKTLRLKSRGFEINAEIAAVFARGGFEIAETPAAISVRVYGRSKLNVLRELGRHARLMARILFRRL